MNKRKLIPKVCDHTLWELIEDSGYWMFQCLGCGVCHEINDLPIWLMEDISNRDWENHRRITTWVRENEKGIFNQR